MTFFTVDYASPSAFDSNAENAQLGLAANARRPVRFSGTVKRNIPLLRFALRALGEAIWSNEGWLNDSDSTFVLDPIITVHPDQLYFEAFSQDESTYVRLSVDPAMFHLDGPVQTGTTNVDFSAWLWGALGEMRSSRATRFSIAAGGFEVKTTQAGGRFEQKVELPHSWVRGLLQVQSAMTFPGTRLALRPIDLLAAIRYLRYVKARVSPRALRYEMHPDQDARLVLEPWEHTLALHGASHGYTESRIIRTWGRQRLKLIEPLLPFADNVRVYLKGRAMPSFYVVDLPGMRFMLGLSGFAGQRFSRDVGFDLVNSLEGQDAGAPERVIAHLARQYKAGSADVARECGLELNVATAILDRLTRQGRVMFDIETREYRHRELFETPIDEAEYFPPDLRQEEAAGFIRRGSVTVSKLETEETRKVRNFKTLEGRITREVIYRDWHAEGRVADQDQVSVVINESGQVIFGQCTCAFFRDNLLNAGPCSHMRALHLAVRERMRDEPTSVAAARPPEAQPGVRESGNAPGNDKAQDGEE